MTKDLGDNLKSDRGLTESGSHPEKPIVDKPARAYDVQAAPAT
jgi:hypothetical protein